MKRHPILLLLISLSAICLFINTATSDNPPMLINISYDSNQLYNKLLQKNLDLVKINNRQAQAIVNREQLVELIAGGYSCEIVHDNLPAFYAQQNPVGTTMGGYLTFTEIIAAIDSLHALYPSICSGRDSIGFTTEGRALWAFKISDNYNVDEDEPEIFFNSLIHAREPMAMQWLMAFAGYLCQNYGIDTTITNLVNNREIWFVPVVNPDGYEFNRLTYPSGGGMWRKNRRVSPGSVDLNRNWGYKWGFDNYGSSPTPSSDIYRGPAAFSEPETNFMRQFIIDHNFSYIMNLHTCGNYYIYPFGYANVNYPQMAVQRAIGDSLMRFGPFTCGTAPLVLYYVNGESNDWQWGDTIAKPPIYCGTIELGSDIDGFWPAASQIPYYNSMMMPVGVFLCQLAGHVAGIIPPIKPIINNFPDTITTDSFTISWIHTDTANPAASYELTQKTGLQIYTEEFEGHGPDWPMVGFSLNNTRRYSGEQSLYSGLGDSYDATVKTSEPYEVAEHDTARFWTWYSTEDGYDYAYFQISTDAGHTFISIPGNLTTNDDPNGENRGNGITGNSGDWVVAEFPLDSLAGQLVLFRIEYITDGKFTYEGIYLDDFSPAVAFDYFNILAESLTVNEYHLSGCVDGDYYFTVRARDQERQWSDYSNRVKAVVKLTTPCPFTPGDINGDGAVVGGDVTYGVRYFKGVGDNPPDSCYNDSTGAYLFASGDVNGNCEFRGSDITFLVAYFKSIQPALLWCPQIAH
jgi:hypothetical protein